MDGTKVCVLGGGIVGLTTALSLQNKFSNVVIFAEKFTTETTSDGAAGLFCPFASFQAATYQMTRNAQPTVREGPLEERITRLQGVNIVRSFTSTFNSLFKVKPRDIVKDSYEYYQNLRNTYGEFQTGILETSGYVLSNISIEEVKNPLIENLVPDYRILTADELKNCPGEWKFGCFFKTFVINGRIFLPWALQMFQKNGGKIMQRKLHCLEDLIPHGFDVIVNCTGMGAKELFGDKQLTPMRGQVIKVSAPWLKQFYLLDNDIYIIPGMETTLGGSREYGNYDLKISKHLSAQIWENCTEVLPSLKEAAVIREWAGLRPYRVPIRLEAETRNVKGEQMKIVHNYGHGAQGVTTAPGTAKIAVELVLQMVKKSKL